MFKAVPDDLLSSLLLARATNVLQNSFTDHVIRFQMTGWGESFKQIRTSLDNGFRLEASGGLQCSLRVD